MMHLQAAAPSPQPPNRHSSLVPSAAVNQPPEQSHTCAGCYNFAVGEGEMGEGHRLWRQSSDGPRGPRALVLGVDDNGLRHDGGGVRACFAADAQHSAVVEQHKSVVGTGGGGIGFVQLAPSE